MKMSAEADFIRVPLRALNVSCRSLLSKLLNPHMELATSKHFCKDYRGLAEVIGFDHLDIKNFERSEDPTKKILEEWEADPLSRPTIADLIEILTTIERYDVIEDARPLFERDARNYLLKQQRRQDAPLQVAEISSNPMEIMTYEHPDILTLDDISMQYSSDGSGCEVTFYDAYVCYAEEDARFVQMLSEYLESSQIGIKLCMKDRDLAAGISNVYEALVRLIEERCHRMLIILSPEFLLSEECKFQARYAASLAVAQRNRKLIPLVYKSCDIPQLLKFVSKVDFTKADVHEWIWKKLVISIKGTSNNNITLPSIKFCPDIYGATQMSSMESGYSTYPLMLETPTRSRSRSASPQPAISFPPSINSPSTSSQVPISSSPSTSSQMSILSSPYTSSQVSIPSSQSSVSNSSTSRQANSSPISRSRWLPRLPRFGLSLTSSNSNNSGNDSSGFHSFTDEQLATSGEVFEERV